MQVTDKAVSTDDDLKQGVLESAGSPQLPSRFDATNLEAVLATLLENKVEAIKQERKQSSVGSSPKSIVHRLRITSTSSTSSGKGGNEIDSAQKKRPPKAMPMSSGISIRRWQQMQPTDSCETHSSNCGPQSQEISISSIDSHRLIRPQKSSLKSPPVMSRQSSRETDDRSLPSFSRQESRESYPTFCRQDSRESYRYGFNRQDSRDSRDSTSRIFIRQDSRDSRESTRFIRQDSKDSRDSYRCCDVEICKCRVCLIQQRNQPITRTCCCEKGEIRLQRSFDEDYISLKIDEECMSDEEERRARRKRRRKRRRRIRRQLALEAMRGAASLPPRQPPDDKVKVLDNDELPPKARWTIVATASLLLFLCLFLVGVTLRMAPLIDDIVRMENEQLINSYNKDGVKLNLTLGHPSVQIVDIT